MKASKITSALSALIDSKIPSFLWGPPGIGKSSIVKKLADDKSLEFIDLRLSLMDKIDLNEVSFPKEGEGILFLDELDFAPAAVQTSAYRLILGRTLGEYRLPKGWSIVAAGDSKTDKETVYKMPVSLANHFVHLEMEVDAKEWKDWAFSAGIDERIIAYIAYKNEDLFSFDPNLDEKSFSTPRSWELVSRILQSGMDESLLLDVISGVIGKNSAVSFLSFTEAAKKLPDIEAIIQKGEADHPGEADVLYMLSTVLVSFLLKYNDEENLENVLKYTLELEPGFAVMIVQDLQRSGVSMEHLPAFLTWLRKFASLRGESCQR